MVSVLVLIYILVLLIPLLYLLRLKYDKRVTHIDYGFLMIEFTKLDKACYLITLISLVLGIFIGIAMIWFEEVSNVGMKLVGTLGLIVLLGISVLVINRLIRAAGRYK